MKLLTLKSKGGFDPAVVIGPHVLNLVLAGTTIDLATRLPKSIRGILASGATGLGFIEEIVAMAADVSTQEALQASGAWQLFSDASIGPVVPDPGIFLSIGANSRGHNREMNDSAPSSPESFFKVRSAIAASGDEIRPPNKYADMLDWEGEMCVVIGTRCHRVSPHDAEQYIAGYTLTNDLSARNNVREFVTAKERGPVVAAFRMLTQLKNFPGFCPVGPVIATKDEFPAQWRYLMETLVNGEVVQTSTQDDLVFTPAEILSYYSEFYIFEPGDIFSLGSPPGVGMAMKPPRFLKSGDVVTVRVKEIGALANRIGNPLPADSTSIAAPTRPAA